MVFTVLRHIEIMLNKKKENDVRAYWYSIQANLLLLYVASYEYGL